MQPSPTLFGEKESEHDHYLKTAVPGFDGANTRPSIRRNLKDLAPAPRQSAADADNLRLFP
jgi:hypothetical protein